ncbi:murein L,D-transpeptidase catalytic domain family protein [Fluoribacter gormanii]|uniref:murein L,D-transpeptidase catalytic domain family protein n=1 Tax=Fluoribacter gormanii TaxID=464 RepID=UPI001040FED1|nr:murein L,D-transpeptidase catalytic domain family protein [Fluoribacter gormanii]MCW8471749.1 murein L,D-transpeptidase catalytic domain family protein [Fluoribacter gormanii]
MISQIAFLLNQVLENQYSTSNKYIKQRENTATDQIDIEIKKLTQTDPKLNKDVIKLALRAYKKAFAQGKVKNTMLTIIDFSVPSNEYRMWIFNMQKDTLVLKTYVAHGQNSGNGPVPYKFSNEISGKQSSLGTYITEGTYIGHNGYSLNLDGLEEDLNSNAYKRRVVVHGAWYVEPSYIKEAGRAGCSWGCPAVAASQAKSIINTIKNGSVLFAYFPDSYFLSHSKYAL